MTTANALPAGLYDLLHTTQLHKRLEKAGLLERAVWSDFAAEEFYPHLAIPLAHEIAAFISEAIAGKRGEALTQALQLAFQTPEHLSSITRRYCR